MNYYEQLKGELLQSSRTWLISGVSGFIGSNLLECLLKLNQRVIGLDNFSTGHQRNLDEVKSLVTRSQWFNFNFIEGDIRDMSLCQRACKSVDYVLHQAALGSVPRSINDPISTNQTNIDGFLNILVAARDAKVKRLVYAASSSTYGDHPSLPKIESVIGQPLSPYAVTKYVNELYAQVFARCYSFAPIGLRYFNVFGSRQDPNGDYAAVIPKWTAALIQGEDIFVNGDGSTSRDFCPVSNVVQANLLAATSTKENVAGQVFNIAVGQRTTLLQLLDMLRGVLLSLNVSTHSYVRQRDFRSGDVLHSLASIDKARELLDYEPSQKVFDGIRDAMPWYLDFFSSDVSKQSEG